MKIDRKLQNLAEEVMKCDEKERKSKKNNKTKKRKQFVTDKERFLGENHDRQLDEFIKPEVTEHHGIVHGTCSILQQRKKHAIDKKKTLMSKKKKIQRVRNNKSLNPKQKINHEVVEKKYSLSKQRKTDASVDKDYSIPEQKKNHGTAEKIYSTILEQKKSQQVSKGIYLNPEKKRNYEILEEIYALSKQRKYPANMDQNYSIPEQRKSQRSSKDIFQTPELEKRYIKILKENKTQQITEEKCLKPEERNIKRMRDEKYLLSCQKQNQKFTNSFGNFIGDKSICRNVKTKDDTNKNNSCFKNIKVGKITQVRTEQLLKEIEKLVPSLLLENQCSKSDIQKSRNCTSRHKNIDISSDVNFIPQPAANKDEKMNRHVYFEKTNGKTKSFWNIESSSVRNIGTSYDLPATYRYTGDSNNNLEHKELYGRNKSANLEENCSVSVVKNTKNVGTWSESYKNLEKDFEYPSFFNYGDALKDKGNKKGKSNLKWATIGGKENVFCLPKVKTNNTKKIDSSTTSIFPTLSKLQKRKSKSYDSMVQITGSTRSADSTIIRKQRRHSSQGYNINNFYIINCETEHVPEVLSVLSKSVDNKHVGRIKNINVRKFEKYKKFCNMETTQGKLDVIKENKEEYPGRIGSIKGREEEMKRYRKLPKIENLAKNTTNENVKKENGYKENNFKEKDFQQNNFKESKFEPNKEMEISDLVKDMNDIGDRYFKFNKTQRVDNITMKEKKNEEPVLRKELTLDRHTQTSFARGSTKACRKKNYSKESLIIKPYIMKDSLEYEKSISETRIKYNHKQDNQKCISRYMKNQEPNPLSNKSKKILAEIQIAAKYPSSNDSGSEHRLKTNKYLRNKCQTNETYRTRTCGDVRNKYAFSDGRNNHRYS